MKKVLFLIGGAVLLFYFHFTVHIRSIRILVDAMIQRKDSLISKNISGRLTEQIQKKPRMRLTGERRLKPYQKKKTPKQKKLQKKTIIFWSVI